MSYLWVCLTDVPIGCFDVSWDLIGSSLIVRQCIHNHLYPRLGRLSALLCRRRFTTRFKRLVTVTALHTHTHIQRKSRQAKYPLVVASTSSCPFTTHSSTQLPVAYTAALQHSMTSDATSLLRHLPFVSVTHFYMDYYSFIDPGRMKGRVGLVGWPTADSLPTQ